MKPRRPRTIHLSGLLGLCALFFAQAVVAAPEAAPWVVAGRQGIIRVVIVPVALAQDRSAYDQQIAALCKGQETCFINFFTNSTHAPIGLPLPDAIDREPTAVMRRSAKQGVDSFRWSCRLKRPEADCF